MLGTLVGVVFFPWNPLGKKNKQWLRRVQRSAISSADGEVVFRQFPQPDAPNSQSTGALVVPACGKLSGAKLPGAR